ncbi:ABC transporter permease [Paucilactobacillus kaifaensis]|uniref:ABC transporter permease n=1 Tax=Paucilactobacillus kaifaensis TaxID=2559921 RepID=UPI0010FA5B3D|nr:ABC transporter permease [Paucilactobacillus kaifaensis]
MIKQRYSGLAVALCAILAGLIVGSIVMLAFGYSPVQNYINLFDGAFGDIYSIGETLRNATPLMLTGLGFSIASKAGFFNIGGSGQYLVAWFGSIVFALQFKELPGWLLIIGAIVVGSLLGGIWSWIAGVLRAYCGTSEVITTIMLNYIALYFVNFAVKNWLAAKGADSSANIVQKASLRTPWLEKLTNNSTFNWGFVIALILIILTWLYMTKTKSGFEIQAVGLNPQASKYAGINAKKTIMIAMLLSGVLAGLAGSVDGLGNYQNISVSNSLPNIGFDGMAVALLANEHPIGIIFAAILFSGLQVGGLSISVYSTTPTEIVDIVIASIIFFVGIRYLFERLITPLLAQRGVKN